MRRLPGPSRSVVHWLDLPVDRVSARRVPTWEAVAERYDRCLGRLAFYLGRHVSDPETSDLIVAAALRQNADLLVGERDELAELRRLRASADRLIEALPPGIRRTP